MEPHILNFNYCSYTVSNIWPKRKDRKIELFKKKCMPVLLYGTEACPMKKSHINSLQFVVNSRFSKIFNTRSKEIIEVCQYYFNCEPIAELISRRTYKFQCKYGMLDNLLCTTVCSVL